MQGFIDPSAIIAPTAQIGASTTIWHFCHMMDGCLVGESCHIGQNVVIQPGVVVGNGCRILNNVTLFTGVTCEDDVFLGPSCVFTNVINPRAFISRKDEFRPTLVQRGASIGANATIVCGHTIGCYAMIGSGSVVTHDVPNYALMVGNPARQLGWVSRDGHRLQFDAVGSAHCPEEGRNYQLHNGQVHLVE